MKFCFYSFVIWSGGVSATLWFSFSVQLCSHTCSHLNTIQSIRLRRRPFWCTGRQPCKKWALTPSRTEHLAELQRFSLFIIIYVLINNNHISCLSCFCTYRFYFTFNGLKQQNHSSWGKNGLWVKVGLWVWLHPILLHFRDIDFYS